MGQGKLDKVGVKKKKVLEKRGTHLREGSS